MVLLSDEETTSDPALVLNQCKEFYQDLYHEDSCELTPMEDIERLIPELDLPSLTDEDTSFLDSPFSRGTKIGIGRP